MVASHPKYDHKGQPHKARESPSHPRSETGPKQEPRVAAATIPRVQRQTECNGSGMPGESGRWLNLQQIKGLFLQ